MLPARRPYEDELASSAVFRCCRQFNVPIKRIGRVAMGRQSWRPSFFGATPLEELAELFLIPVDDLLWNHTTFPYATATMQARYYERALANAHGSSKKMTGFGAVTQNVTVGLGFRRFCRDCADEERRRYAESFWHRSHNLPAVWICTRHRTFLHQTAVPVTSNGPLDKALPHECATRPLRRGRPSAPLQRVADISVGWLGRSRRPAAPPNAAAYRQMAIDTDWLASERQVSAERLSKYMVSTFGRRLLSDAGVPPNDGQWASLMLRPAVDLPFMPVKHALMQCLLGQPRPSEFQRFDHVSSGPSGSASDLLDDFYSRAARSHLRALASQGREFTTEQFLRAVGCWGVYKHRKAELPRLRAVVREFRGSPATVKRLRPGKTLYRSDRP